MLRRGGGLEPFIPLRDVTDGAKFLMRLEHFHDLSNPRSADAILACNVSPRVKGVGIEKGLELKSLG